jgi:hypothetical protein
MASTDVPQPSGMDRRREPRYVANGDVTLVLENPKPIVVRGRLLDVSQSGFRATHMYPALASGQTVRCKYNGQDVMARVVWNRIQDEHVESGFFLL